LRVVGDISDAAAEEAAKKAVAGGNRHSETAERPRPLVEAFNRLE
jgi:hypothetical protein